MTSVREAVSRGERLEAEQHLSTELARGESAASLDLLGVLRWRLEKQVEAQEAWARARSHVSWGQFQGEALRALPTLSHAPANFGFSGSNLLFAAANGEVFEFDPLLGERSCQGQVHSTDTALFSFICPSRRAQPHSGWAGCPENFLLVPNKYCLARDGLTLAASPRSTSTFRHLRRPAQRESISKLTFAQALP